MLQLVEIHLKSDFVTRKVRAAVVKDQSNDVILGCIYLLPCKNSSTYDM